MFLWKISKDELMTIIELRVNPDILPECFAKNVILISSIIIMENNLTLTKESNLKPLVNPFLDPLM